MSNPRSCCNTGVSILKALSLITGTALFLVPNVGMADAKKITFTWQKPSIPLFNVDVGSSSSPSFVDIDADGDFDAFIGASSKTIYYYRNESYKFPWAMFLPSFTRQR